MKEPVWMRRLAPLIVLLCLPAHALPLWQEGAGEVGTQGTVRLLGTSLPKEAATCFVAPGAGAKYRLGNECDNLIELAGYYHYQNGKDAPYVHAERELEAKWPDNLPPRYTGILQSYVEVGNFYDTPVDFWIGQRKNRRRKIHINDYYYMNLKGKGFGLRDIPVGSAKLSYSYMRSYQTPDINGLSAADTVKQFNHDFSLYDLSSNRGGLLALDFRYSRIAGGDLMAAGGPVSVHAVNGWAFALQHEQDDFMGGSNKIAIQYGVGAARAAWSQPDEKSSVLGRLVSITGAAGLESASTWRVLDDCRIEGKRWAIMSSALVERQDARKFDGTDQIWLSIGSRPTYFVDEHWQLTGELGYDRVNSTVRKGYLRKETFAVEWAQKRSAYKYPLLRAYLTHAAWSGAFAGKIGGAVYAADTQAWSGGIQLGAKW